MNKTSLLLRNRQKGLAPILIIILIALAVGGYLLYQKQLKPGSAPQPIAQSSPVPEYTVSVDKETNLKTYTNKKVGFSVRYTTNYQDSAGDSFLTLDDKQILRTTNGCQDRPNFRIELFAEQSKFATIEDFIKQKEADKTWAGKINKQSEVTVDGTKASDMQWSLGKCQDGEVIDIIHNGYLIEINKYPTQGKEKEFDQILSTFKFTQ